MYVNCISEQTNHKCKITKQQTSWCIISLHNMARLERQHIMTFLKYPHMVIAIATHAGILSYIEMLIVKNSEIAV